MATSRGTRFSSRHDGVRETRIEDVFVKRMAECGYITVKGDMAPEKVAGLPDRFFFGPNAHTVIVEFKRTDARKGRRGEKLQDHVREQYRERGYPVYRVQGWDQAEEAFSQITGEEL